MSRASLWSMAAPNQPERAAIEVARTSSQLPLVWITALNAADLPPEDASAVVALETSEACRRLQERAMFLDATLGAGGVVSGYSQLLIDALKSADQPRVELRFDDLCQLDNTLQGRLAVAVQGLEQQDASVAFELPPVRQINPFTQEEMQMPPRMLQGLRSVLLSIADFDRRTRVPTVHRYLTGEALDASVLRNIELLIGAPVGVNTPWRQVVERRARRR